MNWYETASAMERYMSPEDQDAYREIQKSIDKMVTDKIVPLLKLPDGLEKSRKLDIVNQQIKEMNDQCAPMLQRAEQNKAIRDGRESDYQKKLEKFRKSLPKKAKAMEDRIRQHYGETDNPYASGWILTDGAMISMSYDGRTRGVDHRMIGEAFEDGGEFEMFPGGTEGMMMFMKTTGACRMHWSNDYAFFDFDKTPSKSQMITIRRIVRNANDGMEVKIDVGGNANEFNLPDGYEDLMKSIGGSQFI